jgi:myo-inositol-1(or 4)-monophosphatase
VRVVADRLQDLMEVARRAAERGGEVVTGGLAGVEATVKDLPGDYVTEVDLASQRAIVEVLFAQTPDVPVHGEEDEQGGQVSLALAGSEPFWLVDPLDGTTNFVHGFPAVGVSVALIEEGTPVAACVHGPMLRETYVAARGAGAWAVGIEGARGRLSVSERTPEQAVVATGFPFRREDLLERYLATMTPALETFEDLRRPGAAALDLAWVAAGVFDGFFELSLGPWDVAGGGLLIREAGGLVTDWEGGDAWLGGDILAAPAPIHAELLRLAKAGAPGASAPGA